MTPNNIVQTALDSLQIQQQSIEGLKPFINAAFVKAIEILHQCKGRIVISGIGKSAIIAQKIVATLNSTGTPALFLHAADAIHGDLGMMQSNDVAIVISKSGESAEIKVLVPFIKNFGNQLIAICGKKTSFLATHADVFINTTVSQEACPNNLAPTSSTTAQLVMGDAIAICLLQLKGFTTQDFAKFHPGGALGKQLYLRVSELCALNEKPYVFENASIKEAIIQISQKRLGAVAVLNEANQLTGIITDGDIRRMLEKHSDLSVLKAQDIMNAKPKIIQSETLAVEALGVMRANNISQLVVMHNQTYAGMIHIHDLIREGII